MYNILIFGDSISAGRGVGKNKSWPSLLAQNFDSKDKYSTTIHNLSIPGESTNEVLLRFSNEVKVRYKKKSTNDHCTIVFAIGINDTKSIGLSDRVKMSIGDFGKNIERLIQLAHKYTNHIIFVGLTPVDENKIASMGANYFLNKKILNYSEVVKNICINNRISFVEIIKDVDNINFEKFLANDGIHLNEFGHKMVYRKIINFINSSPETTQPLDLFQVIKKEYSLSEKDISAIRLRFMDNKIFKNNFFLGQFHDEQPELIIGAPCIRKDIEGFCLNTFSQIFTPIKIASTLHLPCKLFVGVKEEMIFQPKLAHLYQKLGLKIEKTAKNIAKELGVEIEIVNTAFHKYDKIINESIGELGVHLSVEDSTSLFSLPVNDGFPKKQLHSAERTLSSERIIVCNTSYFLNKLFGQHSNLIVEDVGQHKCVLFAERYEKKYKSPNFLAFLPLPNISGTTNMFKAEKEERFLLGKSNNYYKSIFERSPLWVLETYGKLFDLIVEKENCYNKNFKLFLVIVKRISKYFS